MVKYEPNTHRPHHDEKCVPGEYFITGRMYKGTQLMKSKDKKYEFFDVLVDVCDENDFEIISWVINNDHYHVLFDSDHVFEMGRFINRLHSVAATRFNKQDNSLGRRVWYQYWDHRIRDEEDSWMHFNYNHWNPIKHGCVKKLDELATYPFSSYQMWLNLLWQEVVDTFFETYPIEDFYPFK